MSVTIIASQTQWAVGQGGFQTACLQIRGAASYYTAYDCGSKTDSSHVLREVHAAANAQSRLGRKPHLDTVYISHFDEDHVNGLPALFDYFAIDQVVMPLVSPAQRLMSLGQSSPDGFEPWYGELIADPPSAIAQLSEATEVIPVEPQEGSSFVPPPRGAVQEFPLEDEATVATLERPSRLNPRVLVGTSSPTREQAIWEITPWVPHANHEIEAQFLRVLAHRLGLPGTDDLLVSLGDPLAILEFVRDPKHRRTVRDAYAQVARSLSAAGTKLNRTSMLLYSGPTVAAPRYRANMTRNGAGRQSPRPEIGPWTPRPGWLGTGDAPLAHGPTRRALEARFGAVFKHIGVFDLPHHGSRYDSAERLFDSPGFAPSAAVVACGSTNNHRHPHRSVLFELASRGCHAVLVSEAAPSRWGTSTSVKF